VTIGATGTVISGGAHEFFLQGDTVVLVGRDRATPSASTP
jgi:hypothetical protein